MNQDFDNANQAKFIAEVNIAIQEIAEKYGIDIYVQEVGPDGEFPPIGEDEEDLLAFEMGDVDMSNAFDRRIQANRESDHPKTLNQQLEELLGSLIDMDPELKDLSEYLEDDDPEDNNLDDDDPEDNNDSSKDVKFNENFYEALEKLNSLQNSKLDSPITDNNQDLNEQDLNEQDSNEQELIDIIDSSVNIAKKVVNKLPITHDEIDQLLEQRASGILTRSSTKETNPHPGTLCVSYHLPSTFVINTSFSTWTNDLNDDLSIEYARTRCRDQAILEIKKFEEYYFLSSSFAVNKL